MGRFILILELAGKTSVKHGKESEMWVTTTKCFISCEMGVSENFKWYWQECEFSFWAFHLPKSGSSSCCCPYCPHLRDKQKPLSKSLSIQHFCEALNSFKGKKKVLNEYIDKLKMILIFKKETWHNYYSE